MKKLFGKSNILNFLTVSFLLILPYYLFDGKLYIGGDDTRLFYLYPLDFLRNITFFSWYKVSSLGIEGHSQYLLPFLFIWSFLSEFIHSKIVLNYLAFSLPLILGLIFFQKSTKKLFNFDRKYNSEIYLGSLFYILSPILIINQMFVFLISIYLIGLVPIVTFYFIKFLRTNNFLYVYIASVWCFVFSFALYTIPWLTGFILPIFLALIIVSILFKKKNIIFFLNKIIVFFGFIIISQAFWVTGFISTFLILSQDSFAGKFVSQEFVDTFSPTILSTATGNILYPLLNLFHRQIVMDFSWKLLYDFTNFYDKTLILNVIFIVILTLGILNYKKILRKTNLKTFVFLLISFVFSLYLFTVNIGPLKELFILFGKVPGFTMFRNFQDKFAPGYVFLYASLISISLIILTNKYYKYRNHILIALFIVILINIIPIKSTINSPLWTTDNIYKTMQFPQEYLSFMESIKNDIPSTNNILSIPFGSSVYTVIKDEKDSNSVYAGVSPVKIFSGVNDISGHYSFNFTEIANIIDGLIVTRNYPEFNNILYDHNINYVMVTKNIPTELKDSYLFNTDLYEFQDKEFLTNITKKLIYQSSKGNYELYEAKNKNSLIKSKNVYFKKITSVKYRIFIENLKGSQELIFNDSYHKGWMLFLNKNPNHKWCETNFISSESIIYECKSDKRLIEKEDLRFIPKLSRFKESHIIYKNFSNRWILNSDYIKSNFDTSYYSSNEDGSINVELVLYFVPQNYFYYGTFISFFVFLFGLIYLIKGYEDKKNKK